MVRQVRVEKKNTAVAITAVLPKGGEEKSKALTNHHKCLQQNIKVFD
jgi:hypothetical protein